MAICPIISTKNRESDCMGKECEFFDGCMILTAFTKASECYDKLEELDDDATYCRNAIDSVRLDLEDLIR